MKKNKKNEILDIFKVSFIIINKFEEIRTFLNK